MFSKVFRSFSVSKQVAYLAIFIALSVAANSVLGIELSPSNKITFTYTVCFFAGYILGPVPAFLVGLIGDAIGFLISPVEVYWLYGLTLGLFGFLVGWIMNCIHREDKGWLFGKAILAFVAFLLLLLGWFIKLSVPCAYRQRSDVGLFLFFQPVFCVVFSSQKHSVPVVFG